MFESDSEKAKDPFGRPILWSIPIIIFPASAIHFIYEWSGRLFAVGLFAPVNESTWEHQKLAFLPMLLWWVISFVIIRKKTSVSPLRWFYSAAVAELLCPLFIISFYYVHTGAFGLHSLLLDIASLFIGVILGQIGGLHAYRYSRLGRFRITGIFLLTSLLFISYFAFTIAPPHFPMFMDSLTGRYGM